MLCLKVKYVSTKSYFTAILHPVKNLAPCLLYVQPGDHFCKCETTEPYGFFFYTCSEYQSCFRESEKTAWIFSIYSLFMSTDLSRAYLSIRVVPVGMHHQAKGQGVREMARKIARMRERVCAVHSRSWILNEVCAGREAALPGRPLFTAMVW